MQRKNDHTVNMKQEERSLLTGFSGFAELVMQLGSSTKTNDKLEALVQYFSSAADKDKVCSPLTARS
jgi:hypothetical protein